MCVNQKVMYFNRFLVSDKCKGTIILDRTSENVNYVKDLVNTFGGVGSFIQCGKCIECKSKKTLEWSLRCLAEYETNKSNCYFITLTYDDNNIGDNNLNPHDLKKFIWSLYNANYKFKYYACGEYGCESMRKHFHLILWLDKKINDLIPYDGKYFTSDLFTKLWHKGNVLIGLADIGSIFYVAGYVSKKLTKEQNVNLTAEFQRFSKGIGLDYFYLHYKEMLNDDKIYFNGKAYGLPRYYSKLLKSRFPSTFEYLRKKRFKENFDEFNISNKSDRKLHLSQLQKEKLLIEFNKFKKDRDI